MHRRLGLFLLVSATLGCARLRGPSEPAVDGVRAYIGTLRSSDPHEAYALLSGDVRKKVSFDQFALDWKANQKEREWQAKELEESLKGSPDVGERALISFRDGKVVQLEREGKLWRLESELVSRTKATRPRDAMHAFADAIAQRDVTRILAVLTQPRREGLQRQIEGFVNGIGKHVNDKMEEVGRRAELNWEDAGITYRIVLKKEDDGEWRIDDIYIRPHQKDEDPDKGGAVIPEDF